MEKVIENMELIIKLQPYLKNEKKYSICDVWDWPEKPVLTNSIPSDFHEWASSFETLTLEECINFLPNRICDYYLTFWKNIHNKYWITYQNINQEDLDCLSEYETEDYSSLLEAMEKLIGTLIDNDLLPCEHKN